MTGRIFFWTKASRGLRYDAYHVDLALAALHLRQRGQDPSAYGEVSV